MTAARWLLVSLIGAGAASACLLPSIDPTAGVGAAGTGAAGTGATGSGGEGGIDTSCDPACDDPAECGRNVCADGVCVAVAKGTPVEAQVEGDCRVEVCDGAGSITSAPDDLDAPAPAACKVSACDAGEPIVMDAPDGRECGVGLACLNGVCAGCRSAIECGTPEACTSYECDNPGPAGTCELVNEPPGVACGPGATCANAWELATGACNDGGRCVTDTVSCDPYECAGSACSMTCTASSGCAPGATCTSGACDDCRTCEEWLNGTDTGPACPTAAPLQQLLRDCTCMGGGPCLVVCNTTLCDNASPQLSANCYACLQQSCMTAFGQCAADVDPVP